MLRPLTDEVEAYCPGGVLSWQRVIDPGPTERAAIIAAMRVERLRDGLPFDDQTLERVADYVIEPEFDGWTGEYLTAEEYRSRVCEDVLEAVDEYLERHPGVSGGRRMGWRDGREVLIVRVVKDSEAHRRALEAISDQAVVEAAVHSEAELEAIADRVCADRTELAAAGIELTSCWANPNAGSVGVYVIAKDRVRAQRVLTSRYGPLVRIERHVDARYAESPRAFGSWSAESNALDVFYALDPNGEQPSRCELVERDDALLVSIRVNRPRTGINLLLTGYVAATASFTLAEPVGDRHVIDASTGECRPSLTQLRAATGPPTATG